ncbi:hypothetical protein E2562_028874 [Oryza meyeriana var. granulata]|uniref:Retroviral polymerase SH3-like domain-containing protein n=1 Tax=Oryza meyeriana var. granulata TaxID=110450 RepID=A0A6G1FDD6_9ORYZ|nr:hypothetical protein E2562_028874 [Oryza meyeriana var. granulata]
MKMIFVGYEPGTKAYSAYNPATWRVHITRDVVFDELAQWDWGKEGAKVTAQEAAPFDVEFMTSSLFYPGDAALPEATVHTERVARAIWCPRMQGYRAHAAADKCHIRAAQGSEAEPPNDGRAQFVFSADHRSRMEPRVPDKYLGNCIGPCFALAPKKEIAATGADRLFTARSVITTAVDQATRYEPDYWDRCSELAKELSTLECPPFSVTGSPRFRVYDVDFGFGRPTKVEIVTVGKTGAMSVAEGRGGSGGIEVGIALPPERMERFRRCFSDAMAWLSSSSSDKY